MENIEITQELVCMYKHMYVPIYTIGPQTPSKMMVLSPKDMGEITSKNEAVGFHGISYE